MQLKSFMKDESERLNLNINNTYKTYLSRTFLQRLSDKYKYVLVKGSAAETTYLGTLIRAITDLDIAKKDLYENEIEKCLGISNLDIFDFELSKPVTVTKTKINQFSTVAKFEKLKSPLTLDLQENYNRLIEPTRLIMPKIFEGDEEFDVFVPSFEEYLAEKLCIIAESNKSEVLNTRVKDFYDIFHLHGGKYDPNRLTQYFNLMIKLRGKIDINDASTLMLNDEFIKRHQQVWDKAIISYDFLNTDVTLGGVVYYTRAVLRDQLQKLGEPMPDIISDKETRRKSYIRKYGNNLNRK